MCVHMERSALFICYLPVQLPRRIELKYYDDAPSHEEVAFYLYNSRFGVVNGRPIATGVRGRGRQTPNELEPPKLLCTPNAGS